MFVHRRTVPSTCVLPIDPQSVHVNMCLYTPPPVCAVQAAAEKRASSAAAEAALVAGQVAVLQQAVKVGCARLTWGEQEAPPHVVLSCCVESKLCT